MLIFPGLSSTINIPINTKIIWKIASKGYQSPCKISIWYWSTTILMTEDQMDLNVQVYLMNKKDEITSKTWCEWELNKPSEFIISQWNHEVFIWDFICLAFTTREGCIFEIDSHFK